MQACRLSITDLACQRGDRLLFRSLSFALDAGEALHVTGANGIGKSSLIRIVAGLMRPFAGSVQREGTVGLIDEKSALDPQLPLDRALGFWGGVDGCSDHLRNAQVVGIDDLLDIPVRYLSTGQRKRAALARMLNQGPQIWLLDEPLNGLDRDAQAKVEALVALHCGGGGIALIASHQPIAVPGGRALVLEDYVPDFEPEAEA